MPVERRGLTLNIWSKRGGKPLGQMPRYGTTGALENRRVLASCWTQGNQNTRETFHFETEVITKGEGGAEVPILCFI